MSMTCVVISRLRFTTFTSGEHFAAAITRVLEIVPYAAAIREHVGEIVDKSCV